jgi:tetratricopeptide (TPR) repeat protein
MKELKKALNALREDNGFPHLTKAIELRIGALDPAFKRRLEANNIAPETVAAVAEDIQAFLSDINKTDRQLKRDEEREDREKDIFQGAAKENKGLNDQIEEIQRRKLCENERLKGNESMKAKDYQDAIISYGRALDLNPSDAATFSNRALAYLKTKEYARALEDAEAAIKLKEDYVKAYHRRGKAYLSLNKVEMAIRDF